ncbi:hypothetical protein ACK36Q_15575, partial [Aeromonas veronii]|nr:hypothetical protein C0073_004455 [Aeromonas veronii]
MMVDLKVMAYFKISLSTRNWDRAFFMVAASTGWWPTQGFIPLHANTEPPSTLAYLPGCDKRFS